ncbi:MAG TPA: response regulator transcription factor [Candidatus Binatia bacterium]
MAPIRIVIADDHVFVRAGIRALVERMPDLEVVGEASDGAEVIRLVEETTPDVVLMDVARPGFDGAEATARVLRASPTTRVVAVSVHADPESVLRAIDAGASGYVLKDASVVELELAIHAALEGGTFLSPRVSGLVVEAYRRRSTGQGGEAGTDVHPASDRARLARLTPRQRQILQLVAEGASSRSIARRLELSVKTIESHRAQLMERLGIHDVAGLVRFAIRAGLVRVEP